MKPYFTFFLAGLTTLCFAQNRNDLTKTYDDNGVTLSISIKGTLQGRTVDFTRSYDVADMNEDQKEELKAHVLDSLGVASNQPEYAQNYSTKATAHTMVAVSNGIQAVYQEPVTEPTPKTFHLPFKKEIKMDSEKGELYMHYSFERDGEEFSYEKTVNISGKSDQDRLQLIADYERTINLPSRSIQ